MQDIIPPSPRAGRPVELPPQATRNDLVSLLRQAADSLNNGLGRVAYFLDRETREVVTASSHALHPEPEIEPFYVNGHRHKPKPQVSHRVRQAGKRAVIATKEGTHRARKHLKTPLGKVATVQALALVALFAFVISQTGGGTANLSESERSSAEALENVRRYLPIIAPGTDTKSFDETTYAQTHAEQQLHAWVTPWNVGNFNQVGSAYSSLSAFWGTVEENGSSLEYKGSIAAWRTFKNSLPPQIPTFFTISGNPNYTFKTLTEPTTRAAFIANVTQIAKTEGFTGIDIDFEGLGSANRDLFTEFIRSLAASLKTENLQLSVTVEARIANKVPMDWRTLGLLADEIRIMAYDYHARRTNEPGAIAPLSWVKEVADYAISVIDPKKVVMGLGNYGYDWREPRTASESWEGTGVSHGSAVALAQENEADIIRATGIDNRGYDIGSIPTFEYLDESGARHSVWFEDATSIEEKLRLLKKYPIKGVIFWTVALNESEIWTNTN